MIRRRTEGQEADRFRKVALIQFEWSNLRWAESTATDRRSTLPDLSVKFAEQNQKFTDTVSPVQHCNCALCMRLDSMPYHDGC